MKDQKTKMDRIGKKLRVQCGCKNCLRLDWLKERGLVELDVMWDEEKGKEYIMEEPTLMDDGDEPEDGRMRKTWLPDNIQN